MKKQIVKNVFSNYFVSLLGITLGFVLVPFLVRKLGKEAYGLIALVDSTIIFFEVATIGVRTALARHATFALSEGNDKEFLEYLGTGRLLLFGCAGFVLAAGSIISFYFPVLFNVPPELVMQSKLLFLFVTIGFCISIPNIVFWSVLYSKQRYDLINFAMSFGAITRSVALIFLFQALPGRFVSLVTYGLIYILFTWVQNMMIYFFHKSAIPGIKISMRRVDFSKARAILSFSAYASLQRLSSMFVGNVTNILINVFYGAASNAIFTISTKIPMMMRRLFNEATWSLTPTFTDLVAKKDRTRLESLFFMYTKLLVVVTAPICFLLILFSKQLIVLWVGEEFVMSGQLVALYTAPLLLGIPFAVCGCINNAYGKLKVPSQVGIFYSTFNVISGVILAKNLKMELFGFGLSNLISAFLYLMIFQPYYACRVASISLHRYLLYSVFRPFAPVIIIFGVVGGALLFFPLALNTPFLPLAGIMGSLLVFSYVAAYLFSLNAAEKQYVHQMVGAVMQQGKGR
jgi:O-antigen/teichoic acid export membrane protein